MRLKDEPASEPKSMSLKDEPASEPLHISVNTHVLTSWYQTKAEDGKELRRASSNMGLRDTRSFAAECTCSEEGSYSWLIEDAQGLIEDAQGNRFMALSLSYSWLSLTRAVWRAACCMVSGESFFAPAAPDVSPSPV